jgi:hypothetical protein
MPTIIADRRISGKSVDDQRARCQANIKDFHDYFKANYRNYSYFRNLIFNTSLSTADVALNNALNRPQIEFNIMEAKLSRLFGEFAKQEPNLKVSQGDLVLESIDPNLIKIIEGYIRFIFFESNRDNMEYEIYKDICSGGFSAFKICTEYANEMSFDQNIIMKRCFDPTLVGFDKMAVESHKGDGMFCYECYPKNRHEFEAEYGTDMTKGMKFVRKVSSDLSTYDFNWSYTNDNRDIVMMVDYYEKKIKKAKIVRLVDGQVMTEKEYEKLGEMWDDIAPPPAVLGKARETEFVNICRHRMVENGTLEYVETDYKFLPIVFVDGNSVMLRDENGGGSARQMTRSMMHNLVGVQKLKNFTGIMIANHIENSPQSQWLVPNESIPAEYKDAWINPQIPSTLIYNAFDRNDPTKPLPQPREVVQRQMPAEFMQTFMNLDQLSQTILGSFDSSLGINDNQLSGQAIYNGAVQSNAASQPYMVGYIKAQNRAAEIIMDLIPKYIDGPRSLPIRSASGKKMYQKVNTIGEPKLDYDSLNLQIKVEAGVNFEIQRQQAFQMLTVLMDKVPPIAQFIATEEEGIEMLLDNIEIRGIDSLKSKIKPFMQTIKQQQQQAQQAQQMQMQMQTMEMQKAKQEMEMQAQALKQQALAPLITAKQKELEALADEKIRLAEVAVKEYVAETGRIDVISKMSAGDQKLDLEKAKVAAEEIRESIDLAKESMDMEHAHTLGLMEMHHKMSESEKEIEND